MRYFLYGVSACALAATLLVLGGCSGRESSGIIYNTDGRLLDANSDNMALVDANRFARLIAEEHKLDQQAVSAVITERPLLDEDDFGMSLWYYPSLTITVRSQTTLEHEPLLRLAEKYFSDRYLGEPLIVQEVAAAHPVAVISCPLPHDTAPALPSAPKSDHVSADNTAAQPQQQPADSANATMPTGNAVAEQRYTVQSGDTLALLSSVFYGSPQFWRHIAAANPTLDPAKPLTAGMELIIPQAPTP